MTQEASSSSGNSLKEWMDSISTLKVTDLKSLCRVNHLMVSGNKTELLLRLVKCRWHGGPGKCSRCQQSKFQFVYVNDDFKTVPNKIICKHYRAMGRKCGFQLDLKGQYWINPTFQRYAVPLKDTADRILQSRNIAIGSQLMEENHGEEEKEEKEEEQDEDKDETTTQEEDEDENTQEENEEEEGNEQDNLEEE